MKIPTIPSRIKKIKKNLELLKALLEGDYKLIMEARAEITKVYGPELDLSTLDKLLTNGKGALNQLGLDYEKLAEFYTSKTGKSCVGLTKTYLSLFYVEQNDFEDLLPKSISTLTKES